MNLLASTANALWCAGSLASWVEFRRALRRPGETQARLLRSILQNATDTAFGREHGFESVSNVEEFRDRVPLRDYREFEPWIDRIRAGETRVLTTEPVKRLATTSGTSAARKLIPYTAGLQAQFNRAIGPWIVDLFRRNPSLLFGRAYWSISPVVKPDRQEESAVPIGFEEDGEYLGGFRRKLVDAVMAVPPDVRHSQDVQTWRERTLLHLAECRDLRLISVWHPSFLSLLLDEMSASPRSIWPHLKVVSCWADANAASPARALAERLPGVTIQPKGLIATEAIISIPFGKHWPLAIRSHFFEFIDEHGRLHLAHDLEQAGTYEVVVTTAGGLYRYRLGDQVIVDGFVGRTPSIRFLGKCSNVSDLFGEKLSDAFVGQTLARLKAARDSDWSFAMLAPSGDHYVLWLDAPADPTLAADLDAALRANPHYDYCRKLGQLRAAEVARARPDAGAAFIDRLASLGQRRGDIKPASLSKLDDWGNYLMSADA